MMRGGLVVGDSRQRSQIILRTPVQIHGAPVAQSILRTFGNRLGVTLRNQRGEGEPPQHVNPMPGACLELAQIEVYLAAYKSIYIGSSFAPFEEGLFL